MQHQIKNIKYAPLRLHQNKPDIQFDYANNIVIIPPIIDLDTVEIEIVTNIIIAQFGEYLSSISAI